MTKTNGSKTVFGEKRKNVAGRKDGKPFERGTGTKNRWKKGESPCILTSFLLPPGFSILAAESGIGALVGCKIIRMDGQNIYILISKLKIFYD